MPCHLPLLFSFWFLLQVVNVEASQLMNCSSTFPLSIHATTYTVHRYQHLYSTPLTNKYSTITPTSLPLKQSQLRVIFPKDRLLILQLTILKPPILQLYTRVKLPIRTFKRRIAAKLVAQSILVLRQKRSELRLRIRLLDDFSHSLTS